jgi:hypothetical protein
MPTPPAGTPRRSRRGAAGIWVDFGRSRANWDVTLGGGDTTGSNRLPNAPGTATEQYIVAPFPTRQLSMEIAGRDRVNVIGLLRGYSHNAEMRTDRNAHVLEDPVVLLDSTVVNRDPRVVDGLVHHAERISLRRPSQVINRLGRVSLSTGVDHVDSDHFARLRLGDQFL